MIRRIFSVTVHSHLKKDFERDFESLALPDTQLSPGCLSVQIFKPTQCNPDTYSMISDWESIGALGEKFGVEWRNASIPDHMQKYAISHSISHFESW